MERDKFTLQDVKTSYKKRDSWWTVFLVDPLASRLLLPIANYTNITPNQISIASFLVGVLSAYFFLSGDYTSLIIGAALYHVSFILDCMDGKIARLRKTGTVFGMWVDYTLDRIRVVICAVALSIGQFQQTGDHTFLYLGFVIIALDSTRYMNALHVYKIRREIKKRLRKIEKKRLEIEYTHPDNEQEDIPDDLENMAPDSELDGQNTDFKSPKPKFDLQKSFKSRFKWYLKIRDWLESNRIRSHIFSGIEFQMFIFIIGPIIGIIKGMIIFSAVLMIIFEAAIIYKLFLSTKDYQRIKDSMDASSSSISHT